MTPNLLSRKLLPLLRCPLTSSELSLIAGGSALEAAQPLQGQIVKYPVIDGIPVLLGDRATLTNPA